MKKLILALMFPILPLFCLAQYPNFSPGFKVSPNIGWLNTESTKDNDPTFTAGYSSSRIGFSVGIFADYMIKANYGFSMEAKFTQFGASYQTLSHTGTFTDVKTTTDVRYQFFEIPVSLKMMTGEFGYSRF